VTVHAEYARKDLVASTKDPLVRALVHVLGLELVLSAEYRQPADDVSKLVVELALTAGQLEDACRLVAEPTPEFAAKLVRSGAARNYGR
jgi:hypothetical protein